MSTFTTNTNCLRIERTDGFVICLTELDKDLIINDSLLDLGVDDQTYISAAGYTPTNVQQTSDNAVNNGDIEGVLTAIGVNREDIIGGRYDFAKLHIFVWDFTNNVLVKKLGSGHWGEATIKEGQYVAEFRSLSQQLQQKIGRVYTPECDEQLGGPRCTIDLDEYKSEGVVTVVTDSQNFEATLTDDGTFGDDYFNYGKLLFNTGLNSTIHMEVKDFDEATNTFQLFLPMPFQIEVGDTFTAYAGCDKKLETCKTKFNIINNPIRGNLDQFQGFPHIPGLDQISKFGGQ